MSTPNDQRVADMTAAEFTTAVELAVERAFAQMALPIEGSENLRAAQKDMLFLRSLRERIEGASNKVSMTILAAVLGAIGVLLFLGSNAWIKDQN